MARFFTAVAFLGYTYVALRPLVYPECHTGFDWLAALACTFFLGQMIDVWLNPRVSLNEEGRLKHPKNDADEEFDV